VALAAPQANGFYKLLPIIVSGLAGFLEALVLGLTDDKWDARHNPQSAGNRTRAGRWPWCWWPA
jgi:hypothetical protein